MLGAGGAADADSPLPPFAALLCMSPGLPAEYTGGVCVELWPSLQPQWAVMLLSVQHLLALSAKSLQRSRARSGLLQSVSGLHAE